MARAVVSRMLHDPTVRLKESVEDDHAYVYVNALRELFSLDETTPPIDDGAEAGAEVTELDSRRHRRRS
jgi:hypothetical protein